MMPRRLRESGVERLDRWRKIKGAGSWIAEVDKLITSLTIATVHGPQPLAQRRLSLAEGHEIETHGAIVKGLGRGTPRNLIALGFIGIGCSTLPQFHMGEMGVRGLFVEAR